MEVSKVRTDTGLDPLSDRLQGNPGGLAHPGISGVLIASRRKYLNRLELGSLMEVPKVRTNTGLPVEEEFYGFPPLAHFSSLPVETQVVAARRHANPP